MCKQKSGIHDVNSEGIAVVNRKVESLALHLFAGYIGTE
jgi:hypothetical protein